MNKQTERAECQLSGLACVYFPAALADNESKVSCLGMIYSGEAGRFISPTWSATRRWQQLINTFTGTVQVWLQERQGVSAHEAHVELKTEEGSTAA